MKQRAKKVNIPEIKESLLDISNDSERYINKSFEISKLIVKQMKKKGWLQKDLADELHKSEPEISKLLSGTHNYTLRTISKIEAALGVDIITIFGGVEETSTKTTPFTPIINEGVPHDVDEYNEAIYVKTWQDKTVANGA